MTVKFMYNGIKIDGKLYKAHYSIGEYTLESGIAANTITLYRIGYDKTPAIEGLTVKNETDLTADYFETDAIRIAPENKYYKSAKNALVLFYQKLIKRAEKRLKAIEGLTGRVNDSMRNCYAGEIQGLKNTVEKATAA